MVNTYSAIDRTGIKYKRNGNRFKLLLLLSIILSLEPFTVNAQQSSIVITGKILDENTKKPIPYASIGLMNSKLGTISNEGGGFYLSIPTCYANSTFSVSCVGYKTHIASISETVKQPKITILLSENTMEIGEVVVRSSKITAEKILKKAVRRFNRNYSTSRFELTAFYREHAFHPWKEDPYLNLNDYEVRIQDKGMLTPPDSSVDMQIIKLRRGANYLNRQFVADSMVTTFLMKIFTGQAHFNNLYGTYTKDIVRFTNGNGILSSSPFSKDEYLNGNYKLDGIVELDSMMCYKITYDIQKEYIQNQKKINTLPLISYDDFKRQFPQDAPKAAIDTLYNRYNRSRNSTKKRRAESKMLKRVIYVNKADFAIVGSEEEYNSLDTYYYSDYIRYQKVGNKYYPKVIVYIKPEIGREYHDSTEKYIMPYNVSTLIVTDVKTNKIKSIPKEHRFNSSDILEKVQLPYNADEWNDQVQIPYDDSIYKLIPEKLGRQKR